MSHYLFPLLVHAIGRQLKAPLRRPILFYYYWFAETVSQLLSSTYFLRQPFLNCLDSLSPVFTLLYSTWPHKGTCWMSEKTHHLRTWLLWKITMVSANSFQFWTPHLYFSESASVDSWECWGGIGLGSQIHTVWWWKTVLVFYTCLIKSLFSKPRCDDNMHVCLPCSMCSRILASSLISLTELNIWKWK
jgi:hypothetical protein